jgi:uncharacterized protein YtpQ (UPF0354 family)
MGFLSKLFVTTKKINPETAEAHLEKKSDFIDLGKVYPRIKGQYDEQNPEPFPENRTEWSVSFDDSPVIKPLSKGIGICYMMDEGETYLVIQNKHLSKDLTIEILHEAALSNMTMVIAEKTEVRGDTENIIMVTNGGNFEASMILVDYFWGQMESIFQDEICVAIPANDLLFITAKNNSKARENLKKLVNQYFDNSETKGLIVKYIYERVGNEWKFSESA